MDHRGSSILFLRSTGLIPVKVRPRQKDAFSNWDGRTATRSDHEFTLNEIVRDPELNLAALFSGKYVDLDVDNDDPLLTAALDYFLPGTPYTWGRASKPRSHRAYQLHADFDRSFYGGLLHYVKKLRIGDRSLSIEIRGGKPENSLYSVLPGSIHPSGEEYQWTREIDPTASGTVVHDYHLIKSVRLALASSIIAAYWMEGVRNDLSLIISGLLWRIRHSSLATMGEVSEETTDIDDPTFILNDKDAKHILECVMKLAGDDEADKRSRLLNLHNTWAKMERDPSAKVTGGKKLAEMVGDDGNDVVRALYRLLSDSEDMEELEKLTERFVIWYGQGVLIDLNLVERGVDKVWMTKDQATVSLGDKRIKIANERKPMAPLLFNLSLVRRVMGLTFDPSTTDNVVDTSSGPMVNQWRGFATKPHDQPVSAEEVQPFLDYINNIVAAGSEYAAMWVLSWLADLIQMPHAKQGTALVLVGVQGAGKTFLGEQIIGPIIGDAHYAQTNSITKLTDKFNSAMENRIFLQCDEAIHSYQKDVASRLKALVSDTTMWIEPKGINAYRTPNHLHYLFTSNEENAAMFIDPSPYERRFTVLRVSPHRCNDMPFWREFRSWCTANLPKIMRYLVDYQYDRERVGRPFDTPAKLELQRVGVDLEVSWIVSCLSNEFPLSIRNHEHWWQAFSTQHVTDDDRRRGRIVRDHWPDRVVLTALEDDFRAFARQHGRQVYSGSVTSNIRRVLPPKSLEPLDRMEVQYSDRNGIVVKERPRLYSFPDRASILSHLLERYGAVAELELKGTKVDGATASLPKTVDNVPF